MTIRQRIPLSIALMMVSAFGLTYGVVHVGVHKAIWELEVRESRRTVAHAKDLLGAEIGSLESSAADWGTWNDCYGFMGGQRPDFVACNVLPEAFVNLRVNLVVFADSQGTIVVVRWMPSGSTRLEEPSDALRAAIERLLEGLGSIPGPAGGAIATSEGPLLVGASPILTGSREGPRRGTLLMARLIDEAFERRLGASVEAEARFVPWANLRPDELPEGRTEAVLGWVRRVPGGRIAGRAVLPDPLGHPSLALTLTMPRPLQDLAAQTLWYALASMGLASLVFVIVGIAVWERALLGRLAALAEGVRRIRPGGLSERLPIQGRDELAHLGDAINVMLDTVEQAQETLAASEERFRRMADSIADGIAIIEGDTVVYVNDRACEIFGYPREELLQMDVLDLALPEERERLREAIRAAAERGEYPAELEFWIRRKDGAVRCVHNRSSLSRRDGRVTGRFVVTTDVTERALAERELRRLKAFNERIVETMAEGIVVDDAQGFYTYVNPAAAAILGRPVQELVGLHSTAVVPPDQRPVVEAANERRRQGLVDRYELVVMRPDGTRLPILVSGSPLVEGGRFSGTIAVFSDISERKRADQEREELLVRTQRQADQIRRIIDTVPEGVLVTDQSLHVVEANSAAREYLKVLGAQGHDVGDILRDHGLVDPSSAGQGTWREIAAPFSAQVFEVTSRLLDPSGWLVVIRDVTEARAREQRMREAERMAAVGQVAAGVAHDFNNILAAVIGHAQLVLRDESLAPSAAERVRAILDHGHRAASLVGQLLDYTRQGLLDRAPVDVTAVVRDVAATVKKGMPPNVRLTVRHPEKSVWVDGSAPQLRQALLNLTTNAVEAMPEGGDLTITADVRPRPETEASGERAEGPWVCIRVSDTGRGIPPEHLPKLFQPFFTTKEVGRGTGLGLPQAWGLVRQHGGFIEVESALGRGSTFSVWLPLREEAPRHPRTPEVAPASTLGHTILLVEDDPAVLDVATSMLEALGFTVVTASSGPEALSVYQAHTDIALVLTDLMMPGMDGLALAEELAAKDPSVRVVLVSGFPPDEASRQRLGRTCVGWVQKPLVMERLAAALSEALRRSA